MAGKGRKVWGRETLASADLQDYLQDQVVMRYPSASARAAAIPTATEGMASYLDDVNALEVCTVGGTPGTWERVRPGDTGWQNIGLNAPMTVGSSGAKYRVIGGECHINLHVLYAGSWSANFTVCNLPVGARPAQDTWIDGLFFSPDMRSEIRVTSGGLVQCTRALATNSGGGFVLSADFPVA